MIVRIPVLLAAIVVIVGTMLSAVHTVVLPRATPSRLTRAVFAVTKALFAVRLRRVESYADRDAVMASYAPLTLFALLAAWLATIYVSFAAIFWALGAGGERSFIVSGSSLTTLGFDHPPGFDGVGAAVAEAVCGLVLLALLITYLPSLYGAFKSRETSVAKLEVRAGNPPSGTELLWRFAVLGRTDRMRELWNEWEAFFVDIEESHTSFPALAHFRSPQPTRSWVTASGALLDGAALWVSTVEATHDVDAQLTVRAGAIAFRRIADYFGIAYPADPQRGDPISIRRSEYDEACVRLAAAGLRLRADRDAAWLDFAGWRVNYDATLLGLAALTMAPYAPWSSDRSLSAHRSRKR